MRKKFTLFSLFVSIIGFSRQNQEVTIDKALAGRMSFGISTQPSKLVVQVDTTKKIDLSHSLTGKVERLNTSISGQQTTKITLRCGRIPTESEQPLLVVNGSRYSAGVCPVFYPYFIIRAFLCNYYDGTMVALFSKQCGGSG